MRVLEQEISADPALPSAGTQRLDDRAVLGRAQPWDLFDTPRGSRSLYDSADEWTLPPQVSALMTAVVPGVVDLYVIRPLPDGWRVLVLRRAMDTRCPGAWETVHGRIEDDEKPEAAASRELREETGLELDRLYNVTVQPFYLHTLQTIQLAVVFAAFVAEPAEVTLGGEHQEYEWLSVDDAEARFIWPRERQSLREVQQLLGGGDAGPVEDVLRVY
jgi:dATP pyrophosphohydrolase